MLWGQNKGGKRIMGAWNLAVTMVKRNYKEAIYYIVSVICATFVVFNSVSMLYNENLINRNDPNFMFISIGAFLLFLIFVAFILYTSVYFTYSRTKECALILLSGRTFTQLGVFLVYMSTIIVFIGTVIGIILGFISVPILNLIFGIQGSMLGIKDGIVITLAMMILILVGLIFVSIAYLNDKNILDIMNAKNGAYISDSSIIKIPSSFYVVLYFMPIVLPIILPTTAELKALAGLLFLFISIFGTKGIVEYYLPNGIKKIKRKVFSYHKENMIVFGDLYYYFRKLSVYVSMVVFTVLLVIIGIMINPAGISIIKNLFLFIYACTIIALGIIIVYKLLMEIEVRIHVFREISLLGYRKDIINRIIFKEIAFLFIIIMCIPLFQLLPTIIFGGIGGLITIKKAIFIIGHFIIVYSIVMIFVYIIFKRKVNRFLEG